MSLCTEGNDGKGCNYHIEGFRYSCCYESHTLKMYALANRRCPKFSPFMQPNGDTTEQIMNYCDPYAASDIKTFEKENKS